ncbi:hypothetical protein OE88DRAFT_1140401 [Heliocybe sulcata]|uniref:Uncharacterized protein n=1 Tax=Heliocybe sulcata TaxID=5364 RepID=A0A5C3N8H9_9AGAM|nr:hypothetical protein OE88DRAFT_1140401 [Heliocybe sulcata]
MSPFVLHPRPRPALSHRATLPFVYNPSAPPFVPSHTVPVLVPRPGFPASPDTHIHHIHNDHHYHTRQPYLPPPPQPAMDPVLAREHAYRLQLQYPSGSWRPPAPVVPDLSAPSRQQTQRTQVPQKVWILDCTSCGTFLTNRGMKVRDLPVYIQVREADY